MKVGEMVRVNRPGSTVWTPVVEYHGRIASVDEAEGTCDVLDEERRAPGEPGSIRRERITDVHVGYWERIWHDEPTPDEAPAEGGS